jgi:uracil-DNA glycosylase
MRISEFTATPQVILIGSNPSTKSVNNTPFHQSTKSGQLIREWFRNLDVSLSFANVSNEPTEGNRALRAAEIRAALPHLKQQLKCYNVVIAVGDTAAKALKMLEIDYFHMWHPSGLCRKWNDKGAAEQKIAELHEYIYERRQQIDRPDQQDSGTI